MSAPKKPRKKYQRGKVLAGGHLPLHRRKTVVTETQVLMTLTGLKEGFFTDGMIVTLSMFLTACAALPIRDDMERRLSEAMEATARIAVRHTNTGKWGMSGDEYKNLAGNVLYLLEIYKDSTLDQVASAMAVANRTYQILLD